MCVIYDAKLFRVLSLAFSLLIVDHELSVKHDSNVARRQSSVVSIPLSRRATDPVLMDPLRIAGINVTLMHTAAAVAAAVAAADPQSDAAVVARRRAGQRASVDYAALHRATLTPTPRQDPQQRAGVTVARPCSVVGCTDVTLSASAPDDSFYTPPKHKTVRTVEIKPKRK